MEHLYLFAPENDMALAFGKEHYTPTPAAQKIARDLSLLPLWYASEKGAWVWSQQEVTPAIQKQLEALGVTTRAVRSPQECNTKDAVCHPWGWSKHITLRFRQAGVAAHRLPHADILEKIRQLSGRATSNEIFRLLSEKIGSYALPASPKILQSEAEVKDFLFSQPDCILKAPWSSSGRGIFRVNAPCHAMALQRATSIIRKQGYIMGEAFYDKVQDFALEFYSNGTSVRFAGYSLFQTDSHGAYQGNLLAKNGEIEERLTKFIPATAMHETQKALTAITTALIAPTYTGYFGIDMMAYRSSDCSYQLNPCVELNLRMNMGCVARIIADRLLMQGHTGRYMVEYAPSSQQLIQKQEELQALHPLHISESRITEGFLPLTPILPETNYMAYIVVEKGE